MTPDLTIKRIELHDATVGVLIHSSGFRCYTLELPNKDNASNISCIPKGSYRAFKRVSAKNGNVIELEAVPKRSNIQIHAGNYTRNVQGCILVGDSIKDIDGDGIPDVTNSGNTLKKLLALCGDTLTITIE